MFRDVAPSSSNKQLSFFNDPIIDFRKAMNQVFENFERDLTDIPNVRWDRDLSAFRPKIDIEDGKDKLVICAELPGLTEKDVQVELNKDLLTIKGEKKFEKESKKDGHYLSERSFGSFQRVIRLSPDLMRDKIEASVKNGLLTVTIPKSGESQKEVKSIPVRN